MRFGTEGLRTGTIPGKASFKATELPKFIDALIAIILRNPSSFTCSLFIIR